MRSSSIERTPSGKLRLPAAAAHVERQASPNTRIVILAESGRLDEAKAAFAAMRGSPALEMSAETMAALTYAPAAHALIARRLRALRDVGWRSETGTDIALKR